MRYFRTNATETVRFIPSDYDITYDVVVSITDQSTREETTYNKTLVLDGYLFQFDINHVSTEGRLLLMQIKEDGGSNTVYWSSLVTVTDQTSTAYSLQDGEYTTNTNPDFEYVINTQD